jgi:hypothetical protein
MRKSVNVIGNVHGLDNISGTLWEHFGNPVGSLWEVCESQRITYFVLYKYNMVCYVVHTLYCTIPHIVLYQHTILYPHIVLYEHIVQYPRIVHYNEKYITRANTLLLYSPFASPLTMIMGPPFSSSVRTPATIIPTGGSSFRNCFRIQRPSIVHRTWRQRTCPRIQRPPAVVRISRN